MNKTTIHLGKMEYEFEKIICKNELMKLKIWL